MAHAKTRIKAKTLANAFMVEGQLYTEILGLETTNTTGTLGWGKFHFSEILQCLFGVQYFLRKQTDHQPKRAAEKNDV